MTKRLPAAVLWDMDGTLVDTEPYWMRAEIELVSEFGSTWTHEDALQMVGMGLWDAAEVFRAAGVELPADEIVARLTDRVREQLAQHGVPWQPGAQHLLREIRDAGIPTALVTMSIRSMAEDVVGAIPFAAFDDLVTGDEVAAPKPHPEPYLAAAGRLGVDIADCVAIEDSPTGLAAATSAGAVTIGVPHMLPLDEAPSDVVWESLDGRTLQDLIEVATAKRGTA
ncbi:HAD family hydrolase [Agromyces sp. SYSU T0242]|uniref:HAD family hydrolase n=1 Tax=Agromyces litoreus TaxID=3158561 RepID=UPI003395738A